jgi:homoserine O-acetyltransferase
MAWIFSILVYLAQTAVPSSFLLNPNAPEMNRRAPELFMIRMETSKGLVLIEVHREWAPYGVDHFYNLVRAGYYDQSRFYRVVKDRWIQFGINGDPKISNVWKTRTIPDDIRRWVSNTKGTIAYAYAVPNGRTTQVFVNMRDNSPTHDVEPFIPFGVVVQGMEVMESLYSEYGENSGGGIRAGRQGPIFEQGNAYLSREFPKLDSIIRMVAVEK